MCLDERVQIEKLCEQKRSRREIARRLGRSPSTISREIKRNAWRPSNTSASYTHYRPAGLRTGQATEKQYRASQAQVKAETTAARSHRPYRMRSDRLVGWVIERLRRGWTPEEISGRLVVEFGQDRSMRIGVETLYAWIYDSAQAHRQLWQYLPRGQKRRRRRAGRRVHHERIKWRTSIHHRPSCVEDRAEFGHWEADSVLGTRGTGALHTEVERTSRYLAVTHIASTTAEATLKAQISLFNTLPAHAVRSVTVDNGIEFSWHHKLADTMAVPTYFADPYSAWQRGTNEHFNGRIRKYLPKGTSFADLTTEELTDIVNEINNRPRKVLAWATPAEIFDQLCSTPPTRCASN